MKNLFTLLFVILVAASTFAQRVLEAESAVTSSATVTVKGKVIPYTATAGTQPVWNAEGKPIASLF